MGRAYGKLYGSKIRPKESLRHSLIRYVNNWKCAAFITRTHRSEIETYVFLIYVRLLHKSIGRSEKRNVRLSCERKVQDKNVLLWLERELADENLRLLLEPKVQGYKRIRLVQ